MSIHLETKSLQALGTGGEILSPAVSFKVHEGNVVFLTGENGSGKSTLLKVLLGLHKIYRGDFQFNLALDEIQYLPQLGTLHFHLPLSLQDLLADGGQDSPLLKGLDLRKKWNTASGGERQKILLAAVLAKAPRLLVLDEPFNHVDSESGLALENALIQFLQKNPQSSLILVSHRKFSQSWNKTQVVELR